MSIIAPDSDITLYANVPINEVKNIVFSSISQQNTYFSGKVFRSHVDCTYERAGDPLVLEMPISEMYNFNYISFKNKAFENKTIYARALPPVYVNNEVLAVPYEIDYWQSFMFDITMNKCNILRETPNKYTKEQIESDPSRVFSHSMHQMFTPEPIQFTDALRKDRTNDNCMVVRVMKGLPLPYNVPSGDLLNAPYSPVVCVLTSQKPPSGDMTNIETEQAQYDVDSKIPYLCKKAFFTLNDTSGITTLTQYINQFAVKQMVSSILGIYLVPRWFIKSGDMFNMVVQDTGYGDGGEISFPVDMSVTNPKLNNYPYKYIRVTDFKGDSKEYRLDRFQGTMDNVSGRYTIQFKLMWVFNGQPQVILVPKNYMGFDPTPPDSGFTDVNGYNFDEAMIITDFPQVAYNTDGFLTWLGSVYSQQGMADASNILPQSLQHNTYLDSAKAAVGMTGDIISSIVGGGSGGSKGEAMAAMTGTTGGLGGLAGRVADYGMTREAAYGANALKNGEVVVPEHLGNVIPFISQDDYHPAPINCACPAIKFNRLGFIIEVIEPMDGFDTVYGRFLDKYGYASFDVKVPSVFTYINNPNSTDACSFNSEDETFIKTHDCNVEGPNTSVTMAIEEMFNKGHWFIKGDSNG